MYGQRAVAPQSRRQLLFGANRGHRRHEVEPANARRRVRRHAHAERELRDVVLDLGAGLGERRLPALEHRPGELHDIGVRPARRRLLRLHDGDADGRDDAHDEPADETSAHKGTSEDINRYATAEEAPGSARADSMRQLDAARFLRVKQR